MYMCTSANFYTATCMMKTYGKNHACFSINLKLGAVRYKCTRYTTCTSHHYDYKCHVQSQVNIITCSFSIINLDHFTI